MQDPHKALEQLVSQVEKLTGVLKRKSSQRQIQSAAERDHMKALSIAWFKSYRPLLEPLAKSEMLAPADSDFHALREAAAKKPARRGALARLKALRKTLLSMEGHLLTAPPPSVPSTVPSFSALVADPDMQAILERRWREAEACLRANAPLAATVMMGGLLEGLLLARVNLMPDSGPLFKTSCAPKNKDTGKPSPLQEWTLRHYIDGAHELKWIGNAAKKVGEVLRDYRNFIHPQKELSHHVHVSLNDATFFWSIVAALAREVIASTPSS